MSFVTKDIYKEILKLIFKKSLVVLEEPKWFVAIEKNITQIYPFQNVFHRGRKNAISCQTSRGL
jgi:hypothetical protein